MLAIRSAWRRVIVTGLLGSTVGESLPKYGSIRMLRVLPMRRISSVCKMILEDKDRSDGHEDTKTLSNVCLRTKDKTSGSQNSEGLKNRRLCSQIVNPPITD